jgi:hypothetical protein
VKAAHAPADGGAWEPPLVVDPFAGGGSIPLGRAGSGTLDDEFFAQLAWVWARAWPL